MGGGEVILMQRSLGGWKCLLTFQHTESRAVEVERSISMLGDLHLMVELWADEPITKLVGCVIAPLRCRHLGNSFEGSG